VLLKVNEKKWTTPLTPADWTALPNAIFERQLALGLDAIDINIILHIASYWRTAECKPFPSKRTIAAAMDVEPRTVQRRIAAMETARLIRREERRNSATGSMTNIYHVILVCSESRTRRTALSCGTLPVPSNRLAPPSRYRNAARFQTDWRDQSLVGLGVIAS
jgi:hypothetical protein